MQVVAAGVTVTPPTSTLTPTVTNTPTVTSTPANTLIPTVTYTPTLINGGLIVSPNSGLPSVTGAPTNVQITTPNGYFSPGSGVTILFTDANNQQTTLNNGTINTDPSGNLTTNVTVPTQVAGGNATITVFANGRSVFGNFLVRSLLTTSSTSLGAGSQFTVNGTGFPASSQLFFSLNGVTTLTSTGNVISNATGSFSATLTVPANAPLGTFGVTATTPIGTIIQTSLNVTILNGTPTPSATITSTSTPTFTATVTGTPPTSTPSATPTGVAGQGNVSTAYFAEGYTGLAATNGKATFSEYINIFNPNATTATATLTFYIENSASPLVIVRQVAAGTVLRESVNADVGADKGVATTVTSPQRVLVSRTINRISATGTRLDGSSTQPVGAPSTTWGFPEGYTGITYQEYLELFNPNSSPAAVQVLLAPQAASSIGARTLTLTVPAFGRATSNIRALNSGNNARSVGMIVNSNLPIVAERVEYFGDGVGSGKFGSFVSHGLVAGGSQFRIAYGTSGGSAPGALGTPQPVGDQEYVTLLNPSLTGAAVQVSVGFTDATGRQLITPVSAIVAPGTRQTIVANKVLGPSAVGPFSISIATANGSIEAESAQYFGGSPNVGLHPGVAYLAVGGATTDAFLSELSTQQLDLTPINRSIYLYNPNAQSISVSATYAGATTATASNTYTVPGNGITVVNVNTDTGPTIPAGPIAAELKSIGGTAGFVAVALGKSTDSLSATEDSGMPPS